ncbi:hypothetical protein MHU86_6686 [Fragilaria crotonensis]|nr:hypothetical protein MHU86_6686 [Fragilaria crotonensis]
MASTMCNKGYIDLEQENYRSAISTFNESLAIQKLLLGADNKLVLSTLDNLGYAYAVQGSYDKALALQDFESALKSLCALEDIQLESESTDPNDLKMTQKLMGQVNYQVLKYPTAGCSIFYCSSEADDSIDLNYWMPKKTVNGSKMSGHRVTCA